MSLLFNECPWCGESYYWGIVGTSVIGGHQCGATLDCADCSLTGHWLIERDGERIVVCTLHAEGHPILQAQPVAYPVPFGQGERNPSDLGDKAS